MQRLEGQQWVLLVCLVLSVAACFLLMQPYIEPMLLALLISVMANPVHRMIYRRCGERANMAALISCLLLLFVILLPLTGIFIAVIGQGVALSTQAYAWISDGGIQQLLAKPWISDALATLGHWLPNDVIEPTKALEQALKTISSVGLQAFSVGAGLISNLTSLVVNFLLMLFVLFFALRDHERIVAFIRHALPLSRSQEDTLLSEVETVAKSALLGSLLTALAQGSVGGFALWLAGFPGFLLGALMAFASFIPVVGTALIWLPLALYLLLTGDYGWGVFLIAWGVVVVGSIDNFLRPLFMQGSSNMHTVILFFSLLGGLQLFGLMGVLYGPLLFAITLVLFHLYEQEFADFLEQQDNR